MNSSLNQSKVLSSLASTIAILFFFELISVLNNQWLIHPSHWVYPTDFIFALREGLILPTVVSCLIASFLYAVAFFWYRGGFLRIITHFILLGIASIVFTIFVTTILFNTWMNIHITTIRQWVEVLGSLKPHTQAYLRFWLSFLFASCLPSALILHRAYERVRQDNKVLGKAHFSTGLETYKTGFFQQQDESIIIGKKYGVPLYSNGFEHALVFAPSGSGKTRSIAIPNLFHFPYSVVCNDVKFTLFETTSGYRREVLGHECFCFAPTRKNGITHRFNPLASISNNKLERITDIQQIAHIFMPDNPKEQPIWTQASRKLFKTLMLYLLDTQNHPTTLGEINRLVKQENFDGWLQELLDNTEHFDPEFYRNGYSYLNNHEKTRQGIIETFSGYFELFDDPFVDAATSGSDFDFSDLRRKKMTIYIGFTDEDMERLAPLLTLFWQQLISSMIKEIPDPKKEPYPLLCLIDEFSSLGRIERLRRSLKLLREYRVRCILMFQYIAQTYEKYSHDEAKAFINIKTKVAYTTEDIGDAEFISKMLGTRTKKVVSSSITNQQQGLSDGKSISYQAIPLMRPDEIMKMSSSISLIMRSGFSPIKAKQLIWYQEAFMKNRVKPSVFVPKQTAKQRPFIRQKNTAEESLLQSVECID